MKKMRYYAAILCIASLVLMSVAPAFQAKAEETNMEQLSGTGEGEGNGTGEGEGNGAGEGEGNGAGEGEGNGAGEGEGNGTGEGEGNGTGEGEGNGTGEGNGAGEGEGNGTGEGSGAREGEVTNGALEVKFNVPETAGTLYTVITTLAAAGDSEVVNATIRAFAAAEQSIINTINKYPTASKNLLIYTYTSSEYHDATLQSYKDDVLAIVSYKTSIEKAKALIKTISDLNFVLSDSWSTTSADVFKNFKDDLNTLGSTYDLDTLQTSYTNMLKELSNDNLSVEYLASTFYDYDVANYNSSVLADNYMSLVKENVELIFCNGKMYNSYEFEDGSANKWSGYAGSADTYTKICAGLVEDTILTSTAADGTTIYNHANFVNEANNRIYSTEYLIGTRNLPFIKETTVAENGATYYNYVFDSTYMTTYYESDSENMSLSFNTDGTSQFFPLNNVGSNATNIDGTKIDDITNNVHFGMIFQAQVKLNSNSKLTFSGDDDVFVFIDDTLVLDLGGIHDALTLTAAVGSSEYDFADGEYHTLTLCYLERGSYRSKCRIEFTSFDDVTSYSNVRTDYTVNYYYNGELDPTLTTNAYGVVIGTVIDEAVEENMKDGFVYNSTTRSISATEYAPKTDSSTVYYADENKVLNVVNVYYVNAPTSTPTPDPETSPTPDPETSPTPEVTPEPETTPTPEVTPDPETTPEPEEEIDLDDIPVPEGGDEETTPEPEEEIDLDDVPVPEGGDVLPQTGTLPIEVFYGLGAAMQAAGITLFVKSSKKKKETEEAEK